MAGSTQENAFVETAAHMFIDESSEAISHDVPPFTEGSFQLPISPPIEQPIPLNLPSVLAAIDSGHPVVGQARWRVQQAYARHDQARVLWLPSIQAGFSFHRHDGNYQASNGDIVDVNRNSFQYGLGAGATGAGTTNTRPGIIVQFHLADAIFLPKVTKKSAWAQGHAANAALNDQLLNAASAYFDLVDAHQDLRIVEQSRQRFSEVANITVDFAEAGEGLQADADRLRTELALIDSRLVGTEERVAVAAARLAQAISLNGTGTIVPTDVNAIPLDLTSAAAGQDSLIATALRTRPELKESQALVAAACEAFQREKYAPFVPSVLLGFSTGGFGGGLGNNLDDVDGRYDFDALLAWEIRNLGLGEKAARREQSARVQQARFEKLRVMDQVAREVSESHSQVAFRRRQIDITLGAIKNAEDSYRRNLERIRDGEGLPLEVLQSAQALESAQRAYLRAVMDYNQAQIRLQWSLGFPVNS
ncbi:MAG: TolC family protein [Pirellulaceae bacterium]